MSKSNLRELEEKLREVHERNDSEDLVQKVELCFEIMELYSGMDVLARTKDDHAYCLFSTQILCGVVQPGLSERVIIFLKDAHIPTRAKELLRSNFMHMRSS